MPELDFDKEFQSFMNVGDGSAIQDIYKIIPTLTNDQIKIINTLNFYIERYELTDLKAFLADYIQSQAKNKNLNFVSSMNVKALLKAYTMEEYMKGISVSSSRKEEK